MVSILLCLFTSVSAQNWYGLGASINSSTISYQNSQFENYRHLKGNPGASITFLYQAALPNPRFQKSNAPADVLTTSVGYKSIHLSDRSVQLTTWSFNYLTTSIGGRHYHNPKNALNVYYGSGLVTDFLFAGTQLTPSGKIDLTDRIRRITFGVVAEGGLNYHLTEDTFGSVGIGYQRGIRSVEKDRALGTWFHSWKVTIAMIVALNPHRGKSQTQPGRTAHTSQTHRNGQP